MSDSKFLGRDTKYGFQWGPATIERMAELPRGIVFALKTDALDFQIYVSAKGKSIRIHDGNGVEWKPSA